MITSFVFFQALTLSCAAKLTGTSISGKLANTGEIAITRLDDLNRKTVTAIKNIKVGDDGSFSATIDGLEPNLYALNFPSGGEVRFFADGNEEIVFEGDASKPEAVIIRGSDSNKKLADYEKFRKESLKRLVTSVRDQLAAHPTKSGSEFDRLGALEVTNYEKHREELLDYVINNMGTSPAVYATSIRWPGNIAKLEPFVTRFEKANSGLPFATRVREKFEILRQTSIGGTVPDIKMRDETGTEVSLFATKGRITLIDFWGSWCGPCRREAVNLSDLYKRFNGQGFEIFGVALETDMKLWKEARDTDMRIWPNVLSLKEFETDAAYDYGVTSLPANFLIDESGKVIGKDLHGAALSDTLERLMKKE